MQTLFKFDPYSSRDLAICEPWSKLIIGPRGQQVEDYGAESPYFLYRFLMSFYIH